MKFSIKKSVFLKALSHGQSVVEKRTTIPVLSHVMIYASAAGLSLTTTDMDLALIETVPADVSEEGGICAPAQILHDIVKKLNERFQVDVQLLKDKGQIVIVSGKSRFEISCLQSGDFPQLTHTPITHQFIIDSNRLMSLIDTTRFSMSTDETRYALNGLYFHNVENRIYRVVGTDLHRLACIETPFPDNAKDMPSVILGKKTVNELCKLISDVNTSITVGISASRVEFSFQSEETKTMAVLTSRLIDGDFPDYEKALLSPHDKKAIINTKELKETIDRVGTVSHDRIRSIRLMFERDRLTLSVANSDYGSAVDEIEMSYPYDQVVTICFNVRYLFEIVSQIKTEECAVSLLDDSSSAIIGPSPSKEGLETITFVIMPMQA